DEAYALFLAPHRTPGRIPTAGCSSAYLPHLPVVWRWRHAIGARMIAETTSGNAAAIAKPRIRMLCSSKIQSVFEDFPVLHDDDEVLCRIFDELDVGDRVAVGEQEVGECAFLDHPELAGIRIALAGQLQQLGIRPGRHDQRFGGCVPADELRQQLSLSL